jgi:hypothetical protein
MNLLLATSNLNMKALLASGVFFALVISLVARNQTNAVSSAPTTGVSDKPEQHYPVSAIVSSNAVTFPVLLSNTSEPLMTNALFHSTFGRKVIFGEDLSIQAFDVDHLHPSVLAQLNLDPDKLKADQQALDERYQQWTAAFRQQLQKYLASESTPTTGNSSGISNGASTNSAATNTPPHRIHYRYYRSSAGKHTAKAVRTN